MTRKGLAFGAGFALLGTSLAALPAYAVEDISLVPYWGAGDANELVAITEADAGIVLSTELANIGSATASNLKYMVEILNDNTTYTDLKNGTGANFAAGNDIVAFSQHADRLGDTPLNELSAFSATVTDGDTTDQKFVITPVVRPTTTNTIDNGDVATNIVVSGGADGGADSPIVTITVDSGHGFVAGDIITIAAGTSVVTQGSKGTSLVGDQTLTAVTDTTLVFALAAGEADADDNGGATAVGDVTYTAKTALKPCRGQKSLALH